MICSKLHNVMPRLLFLFSAKCLHSERPQSMRLIKKLFLSEHFAFGWGWARHVIALLAGHLTRFAWFSLEVLQ